MRSALLVVAVLGSAAHADVSGCWEIGANGARLTVHEARGALTFHATFPERPRGGPAVMTGQAVPVGNDLEVACRPMSQHGSFCRIRPEGDRLRVRVFALHHGDRKRGHLVDNFVANRCRPR